MEKSFVIPSVFEENTTEFHKVAENFVDGIKIVDFKGRDYLVGNLALREGNSPHKLINTTVGEVDYQLLAVTGLAVASLGRFSKLVVTAGFPYTTYQSYRKPAEQFMSDRFEVKFDSRTFGGSNVEKASFQVDNIDIMTEVDGCVIAIREGLHEKNNFFIASLGYGTFELAQSLPKGIVHRTSNSTKGLQYAVNILENELKKEYYLNLLTEQQIERAFQRGLIVLDRQRINLREMRLKALSSYYNEVISPTIRRKITNEDYTNTDRFYLVGGGAMYPELVDMFREEFSSFLDVIVYPEPFLCAGKGYCLNSMSKSRVNGDIESKENTAYVGLDIGNSNTVVFVSMPD
jgi:plasmid segregation protein ParM